VRPTKLILEGFTSFRARQYIDFAELDNLFAITGQTGAGKTSLLDAISFALYGKVARKLNPSELVSQGSKTLKVELQFLSRQNLYRTIRTYDFSRKTASNTVILERHTDEKWLRLKEQQRQVDSEVARLLGIDYDTFTKVILLPQGEFDKFLKGTPRDRREILRQLIPELQVFESMRQRATEREKLLRGELNAIEAALAKSNVPDAAAIAEVKARHATIETELGKLDRRGNLLQRELTQARHLLQQQEHLTAARDRLNNLIATSAEIETITAQLQRARIASQLEREWMQIDAARTHLSAAERSQRETTERLQKTSAAEATSQAELTAITQRDADLREREAMYGTTATLETARVQCEREYRRAGDLCRQRQQSLQAAQESCDRACVAVEQIEARDRRLTAELEQHSSGLERIQTLQQVLSLLPQWSQRQERLQTAERELKTAIAALATAENEQQARAESLSESRSILEDVAEMFDAARRDRAAATVREQLHAGDTCPVCNGCLPEAEHLPELPGAESARYWQAQLDSAREEVETGDRQFAEIRQQVALARQRLETTQQTRDERQQDWLEIRQQLHALLGDRVPDSARLAAELETLQSAEARYQAALKAQTELRDKLARDRAELQAATAGLDTARAECERATAELQARLSDLQTAERELANSLHQLGGDSYGEIARQLQQERQECDRVLAATQTAFNDARAARIRAESDAERVTCDLNAARDNYSQCDRAWTAACQEANLTEADFLDARAEPHQLREWQQRKDAYDRARIEVTTQIEQLQASLGDTAVDRETVAALETEAETLGTRRRDLQDTERELLLWSSEAERQAREAQQQRDRQTELAARVEVFSTLAKQLQSNQFQAYILESFERDLALHASQLLQDLTQRYTLSLSGDKYVVEDSWNSGEIRPVQTLSGGETFVASLAVGLALSELLAGSAEVGSLFLDEGFGTLDPETLESAIQALENLRQDTRAIGLITHVRELADRLPAHIEVIKSPDGSHIRIA